METLHVELGRRRYPIVVGRNLPADLLPDLLAGRAAACLVDAKVSALHSRRIADLLAGIPRLELPSGEASKSLEQVGTLASQLLELGLGRDGVLLALGGGVTGDLAGFLAASYLRGIAFVQIPSTLLAQVDASVGGKVAVNLPGAKNSLGFFHQPEGVLADLAWFETLPPRQWRSGLAEIVKMAAIGDEALLGELEGMEAKVQDWSPESLTRCIVRCCRLKSEVVAQDEREGGLRQILNFGHTFGHAVEMAPWSQPWLHGEAVALGMLFALRLGEACGTSAAGMAARLECLLADLGLPRRLPAGADLAALRSLMDRDKKRRHGGLGFVLLEDWGRPVYGIPIEEGLLLQVMAELRE